MPVVREDVVKLGFDYDQSQFNQANSDMDDLMKSVQKLGGSSGTGKAEDGFDDATKAAKKLGCVNLDKLSDGLDSLTKSAGKLALNLGTAAMKGLAVATAAGVGGIAVLTTAAIKNYAEYEQLVGGVDTLFGDSSDRVVKYANDAFKTAGLSANEYMATVTSFSASLLQSCGGDTEKAAGLADQAITDMSDNANKMGTDMSSIQDAYQGFAKQNYTMLDNLKLGYGGTKEEMERLLRDASAISGVDYDISSYADVVEALHVIQTNMGITGTTAKEASSTIQGSAKAMGAAWTNFITGMADENADFDQLFDNLIDSVEIFMKNLIPRIKATLPRLIRGLTEIGKTVGKELPGIIKDLLPELARGARELVASLFDIIVECGPLLKDAGLEMVKALYKGFTGKNMSGEMFATIEQKADDAFEAVKKIIAGVVDFGQKLWNAVGPALLWIADLTLDAFVWIGDNIDWILPVLGSLLGAMLAFRAVKGVTGIVSGFMGLFGKGSKGGSGGSGLGGLTGDGAGGKGGFFSSFASLKPSTILKGMGNLALVLGGLGALAAVFMWVSPYLAELSDWKSMAELLTVMVALGLVGTGMTKLAGSVGNIPVATVAKGLANIAIVLVGFGALAAAFMWLSPYINKLGNMEDTFKLLVVIGAVGLIGSALAGLAGLIGMIPIPVVLSGLANIALALVGFTAIVSAFSALSLIPGFDDFIARGGEVLTNICGIVGEMAGSLIGGIGEGIAASLPGIGEDLSAFATSIEPAMTTFSSMDFEGLKNFATAFGAFVLAMTGEAILSWFTGGIDYAKIGSDLTALTTNGAGFFAAVQTIPEAAFTNATKLFECLNGIGLLPNSGGVVQWFTGTVDYAGIATGLASLATTTGFFTAVQAIPEAAFTNATKLFECLNGIGLLPNSGGVVQWFMGEVDYQGIADGLAILGGATMIAALTAISGIPAEAFTSLTSMFDALAGIKQMPKEGGIFGWFTGDNSTGLSNVAAELPGVATNIASFFTNLGGITDFTPISNLFNTLSNINIDTDVADKGFWSGVSQLGTMGTELSTFATNASSFFTMINTLNLENLTSFFEKLGGASELPTLLEGIDGELGTVLSNMKTTIETGMADCKTAVETGLTACISVFSGKVQTFYMSGQAIMSGLNRGMLSKKATLIATANSIASSISKTIDDAMDINSPSKVTMTKGQYISGGLALGMEAGIPDIELAANKMSNATIPYSGNYTPSNSSAIYNNGGNSEHTTISPVFNLTISGTQDDRTMARKVKRYVAEAIDEALESLERKTYVVREV